MTKSEELTYKGVPLQVNEKMRAGPVWGSNVLLHPTHTINTVVGAWTKQYGPPDEVVMDGSVFYFMGGYWHTAYQDIEVSEHD